MLYSFECYLCKPVFSDKKCIKIIVNKKMNVNVSNLTQILKSFAVFNRHTHIINNCAYLPLNQYLCVLYSQMANQLLRNTYLLSCLDITP